MTSRNKKILLLCGCLLFVCIVLLILFHKTPSHKISRSFYYWKSIYKCSKQENDVLKKLNINTLYIKYFDINWDKSTNKAIPIAKIEFETKIAQNIAVVPCVYISNKALRNTNLESIDTLAKQIVRLILSKNEHNNIRCKEIQCDCDWTDATQKKYFLLLKKVKTEIFGHGIQLSATIRLHQIKYCYKTGIPPVDKGMLMFYNMGRLQAGASSNSIFNENDAAKYVDWIDNYPLPMDVALPLFSWAVHLRHGKIVGLINTVFESDIQAKNLLIRQQNGIFTATKGFFFRGQYIQTGDELKLETITPKLVNQAASMLSDVLPDKTSCVALYHFDSTILSHYETSDIDRLFTRFE